jgi:hypothetical protein
VPRPRVQQLERCFRSLGEHTWQGSDLRAPDDFDALHHRIDSLEAEVTDTRIQFDERADELSAARLANHGLMAQLNARRPG